MPPLYNKIMRRIIIDASRAFEKEKTGVSWYCWNLLTELMKIVPGDWEVILPVRSADADRTSFPDLPPNWRIKVLYAPFGRLWSQIALAKFVLKQKPDVFFVPSHVLPALVGRKIKSVVTIHDIAAINTNRAYSIFEKWYSLLSARHAMRVARAIIVPSYAVKQDILQYFPCHARSANIIPVHHGVRLDLYKPRVATGLAGHGNAALKQFGITQPYVFALGRIEEKKNTLMLVHAFEEMRRYGVAADLVLAGPFGYGAQAVKEAIQNSEFKDSIKVLGWVSQEQISQLMQNAQVFVFPSRAEGFGIPVLEAMACGTPSVASDIPVLREVGGSAIDFASPSNSQKWARKMAEAINGSEDVKNRIKLGLERAQAFTWRKCAEKTWEILQGFGVKTKVLTKNSL